MHAIFTKRFPLTSIHQKSRSKLDRVHDKHRFIKLTCFPPSSQEPKGVIFLEKFHVILSDCIRLEE